MKEVKTLEDIEKLDREFLIPKDVAPILGCDQYGINVQARDNPDMLGFPVIVIKSRVKIPKEGFLNFCRFGKVANIEENGGLKYEQLKNLWGVGVNNYDTENHAEHGEAQH